jgi:uncharacterized delta-60 repeat protein
MAGISKTLANPGTLDTSFSYDGQALLSNVMQAGSYLVGATGTFVHTSADGKVLLAGTTQTGNYEPVLVRLSANGNLDSTFGGGDGVMTVSGVLLSGYVEDFLVQPDGKVLLFGDNLIGVLRITPNGNPDTSFGTGGQVLLPGTPAAVSGGLQADGKVLVSTTTGQETFLRYSANGVADPLFDGDGKFINATLTAGRVFVQADQKIVATTSASGGWGLVRYFPDLALDTTFSGDGKVTTSVGVLAAVGAIAQQDDGKLVVAGTIYNPDSAHTDFAVVRYKTNGDLDTAFSGDGKAITSIIDRDIAYAISIQPDGKIVVGGISTASGQAHIVMVCYNTNGTLDSTFGNAGKLDVVTAWSSAGPLHMDLQEDGRLVVAATGDPSDGSGDSDEGSQTVVIRLFATTNTCAGSAGNDTLTGAAGSDLIKGLAGADVIKGGAGIDMLYGGAGNDKLTGGTGADKFVFDSPLTSNKDTILDFHVNEHDKVVLDNDVFTKLGGPKTLPSTNFAIGSPQDANDYIIYSKSTGTLYYDVDGNGPKIAVAFAVIGATSHPTLQNTDFAVVN